MKKTIPLLAVAALLLAGCEEKVIDIDPGIIEKKVVAMAHVEADSAIGLRLTYSRFFLDAHPFTEITNATVSLTVNGNAVMAPVSHSGGDYTIPYAPQPGDRLALNVSVPGHDPVTAETTVPAAPVISTPRLLYSIDSNGDTTTNVRFRLDDNGTVDNYYAIRVREEDTVFHKRFNPFLDTIYVDTVFQSRYIYFSCNDVMITDNTDLNLSLDDGTTKVNWLPFPDDMINGTSHEIAVSFYVYSGNVTEVDEDMDYMGEDSYSSARIFLEVTSYTRDRYLYEVTRHSYSDDLLSSMFTEPVQIHTNVKGGIGVFAALSRTIVEVSAE